MDAELRAALHEASSLVFLCSGNIIRSAFAELYARHLGCPLPVRSGGTVYDNRSGVYPETAQALAARGVPRASIGAFRSTHLDSMGELDPSAVVFGMTREHLQAVVVRGASPAKCFLVLRLTGADEELADPMFHGGFERSFARLSACVEALAAELA